MNIEIDVEKLHQENLLKRAAAARMAELAAQVDITDEPAVRKSLQAQIIEERNKIWPK